MTKEEKSRLEKHYINWLTEKVNNDSGLKEEYCDTIEKELNDEQENFLFRLCLKVEKV